MKINFSPILHYDLTGIGSAIQGVAGLAQTIGGWVQQHRATKQLENLQSPTYAQNSSILDYYNKALSRYNTSPTDSALYKGQQKNIQRGLATGLSALGDRRSALGGITRLVQAGNDASLNAQVAAENQQNQRFGQLGGATQMKAGEDRTAFDINQQQPYERKYNLLSMKAGGGNQVLNSGLSNIFGAGSSLSQMGMLKQMYGDESNGKNSGMGTGINQEGIGFQDFYKNARKKWK